MFKVNVRLNLDLIFQCEQKNTFKGVDIMPTSKSTIEPLISRLNFTSVGRELDIYGFHVYTIYIMHCSSFSVFF